MTTASPICRSLIGSCPPTPREVHPDALEVSLQSPTRPESESLKLSTIEAVFAQLAT